MDQTPEATEPKATKVDAAYLRRVKRRLSLGQAFSALEVRPLVEEIEELDKLLGTHASLLRSMLKLRLERENALIERALSVIEQVEAKQAARNARYGKTAETASESNTGNPTEEPTPPSSLDSAQDSSVSAAGTTGDQVE